MSAPEYKQYTCNLCGKESAVVRDFHREGGACQHCGSNIRFRALMFALSHHFYDKPIPLANFSPNRNQKAMGLSDAPHYADKLKNLFDYTNYFYHTEPFLDICNIENMVLGSYDLLISSDVYEHVSPPRHVAFVNSWQLLKPDGLMLLTVPYTMLSRTVEHFPDLNQFGIIRDQQGILLVNQRKDQSIDVYDRLTWHGGEGSTLEMRVYSEADLLQIIADAGFKNIKVWRDDYPEFGILQAQQGGSFVISAIKDGNRIPIAVTKYDPYIDNIFPEDAEVDHFLVNRPIRITDERAKKAIAQWKDEKVVKAASLFSRIKRYLHKRFRKYARLE
jgi:DNA-directed RNA polymerase subunit RPC12/RpoP/SAM-dependent methyltransferase